MSTSWGRLLAGVRTRTLSMLLILAAAMSSSLLFAASPVTVDEVTDVTHVTTSEAVPYEAVYVFNRNLRPGQIRKVQDGQDGEIVYHWKLTYENGTRVGKELIRTEYVNPTEAVFQISRAGFQTSRSTFQRSGVMEMESTAYTPDAGRGSRATFRTATGRRAEFGVVAVDPDVIPLGTILYVEGYGLAIAADTGGAIRGRKIDVCVPTREEALNWGRRNVRVHIFQTPRE